MPPAELATVLDNIKHDLYQYGSFQLAHEDIVNYYSLQDITYVRKNGYLYITVKIPLSSTNTIFTVYRIHSVPITLSLTNAETSIMNFDRPYFAISNDRLFYILSESEFALCKGKMLRRCSQSLLMKETSSTSCALALFLDDSKLIANLCDFTLCLLL